MSPRVENNYNGSKNYKPNNNGSNSRAPEGKSSLTSSNIGRLLSNYGSTASGSNSSSSSSSLSSSNIQKAFMALGKLGGSIFKGAMNTMQDVVKNSAKWVGNKLNYAINAMTQGFEGNCAALAAIQSVGAREDGEQILRKTIHPIVKDGKTIGFNVTFQGAGKGTLGSQEKPISVSMRAAMSDPTKQRNKNSDLETAVLNQAIKQKLGAPPYMIPRVLSLLTGEKAVAVNSSTLMKAMKDRRVAAVGHWANHAWSLRKAGNGGALLTRNPHNTSRDEQKNAGNAYQLWITIPKKKRYS